MAGCRPCRPALRRSIRLTTTTPGSTVVVRLLTCQTRASVTVVLAPCDSGFSLPNRSGPDVGTRGGNASSERRRERHGRRDLAPAARSDLSKDRRTPPPREGVRRHLRRISVAGLATLGLLVTLCASPAA